MPESSGTTVLQVGAMSAHGTADRLHHIAVPTTVVHGDMDRFIAADAGAALATGIASAEFRMMEAGHLFWLEQPEQTAELISRCVARA